MKPFNLEKALSGAKCITRYGCEAYVKYREDDFGEYPLRGFYYIADDGNPTEARWTIDGCYRSSSSTHPLDIFMAPEKMTEPTLQVEPVAWIYFDGSFSHVLWNIPAHLRCSMDVYAVPQPSTDLEKLVEKMRMLIAAGKQLSDEATESQERTFDGGAAEVASIYFWNEFRDALETATEALAAFRQAGG